jgi:hypothetical protein
MNAGLGYTGFVPLKLTDSQIEMLCREVLARESTPSGRNLRRALRERYGTVGRTDRVYAIWKRLSAGDQGSGQVTDAERSLWTARLAAAEQRAQLAEEREIKHQDHWASEVHALREQLRARPGSLASGVSHEAYHRVHQELLQVRGELEQLKLETGRS